MKKHRYILKLSLTAVVVASFAVSCGEEFLDRPPLGTYDLQGLSNIEGIEGMLIGAYSSLNGRPGNWYGGATNWLWGSVGSDDSYKGSEDSDQNNANFIEAYDVSPANPLLRDKWNAIYDGVALANETLRNLALLEGIDEDTRKRITGEARLIRGHQHFEGMKMFFRVPYVSEEMTDLTEQKNVEPIWPQIEADFRYGYENLPEEMPNKGRVNRWAAAAYLAKALMFQNKYAEALPILNEIIEKGVNSQGDKLKLNESFHDNFRIPTQNNPEILFSIQSNVMDQARGRNGNYENVLNYPHNGGPGGCCGFFQPSQSLVNSYRTDASGLPLLDDYNNEDVTSDAKLTSADDFTPYQGTLDPRLDWTVGRRGIPYLDWGVHPGRAWIRDVAWGGPYSPKKNVYYKAEEATLHETGEWGQHTSALDFPIIRFADVLLWAAEAEAEVGSPETALKYVNDIRDRADNIVVMTTNADGELVPAAKYNVEKYTSFPNKEFAIKAIRFERKLELAMEGHRRFDLVRWGIAAPVLNAYLAHECKDLHIEHLCGVAFEAGKDEYYPIHESVIQQSRVNGEPTIIQPYVK